MRREQEKRHGGKNPVKPTVVTSFGTGQHVWFFSSEYKSWVKYLSTRNFAKPWLTAERTLTACPARSISVQDAQGGYLSPSWPGKALKGKLVLGPGPTVE
eukprot:1138986-Pelagomonas_calceolata.AAC.9